MRYPQTPKFPLPAPLALRLLGVVILLVGLGVATLIWQADDRSAQADAEQAANPAMPLATMDSKKQSREVEIYYGKTGLLMERGREELRRLTHGKPLAISLALVCGGSAWICFLMADRWVSA